MTVGGVDTYYDYDEKQWKSRRLGGGPIHRGPVCPAPRTTSREQHGTSAATHGAGHPKSTAAQAEA
jgi:hypothetical protein